VCANLVFDLTDPEGERRLRECLDALQVKMVLWGLDQWLREQVKYAEEPRTDQERRVHDYHIEQLEAVRLKFYELLDEYNVNLED
jgi:hypothetical protein